MRIYNRVIVTIQVVPITLFLIMEALVLSFIVAVLLHGFIILFLSRFVSMIYYRDDELRFLQNIMAPMCLRSL